MRIGFYSLLTLAFILLSGCASNENTESEKTGRLELVILAEQNVQCANCYVVLGNLNELNSACIDIKIISNHTREVEETYFKKKFSYLSNHDVQYVFDTEKVNALKLQYELGDRLSFLIYNNESELIFNNKGEPSFDFQEFENIVNENCNS